MATFRQQKHSQNKKRQSFLDVVFSWSISDILNKHLYKFQVEELPLTFSSTTQYMNSFIYPLLEETRADLHSQIAGISRAPACFYINMHRIPTGNHKELLYRMTLNGTNYLPKAGDLIALTQSKPKSVDDLARPNVPFIMAFVKTVVEERPAVMINVLLSEMIVDKSLQVEFVVYLTNLTTYRRLWEALNPAGNMNIIQRTLSFSPSIAMNCDQCFMNGGKDVIDLKLRKTLHSFKLDTSQEAAVLSFLEDSKCLHQSSCSTKLIWGPPGTGKTKTIASLLFLLLRMKRRTLTCAPTNIAVVGVVTRLLSLVRDNYLGCDTYGLGDIVLFGNKERMKISDNACDEVLHDVFLDNRIESLLSCLSLWRNYVNYMIQFLENPMQEYLSLTVTQLYNTMTKSKKTKKNKKKKKEQKPEEETVEDSRCTFETFAIKRFNILAKKLICCLKNMYTHLPSSVVSLNLAKKMYKVTDVIKKIGECLKEIITRNESLKEAFDQRVGTSINSSKFSKLNVLKTECLQALKELRAASCIPKSMNEYKLKSFCLSSASLIFCTASSSIKLYKNGMKPIEFVLIDEAAQLKECESIIPLQLPGASKAVLIGDERQLQSMVQSKICEEAKFGRSLFERLVLLGHKKHLLNVQYRMHPSISMFPKTEFYDGLIMDGPNVILRAGAQPFLEGGMYGSYSFIDVDLSEEEHDSNHSTRNMVEVAVIVEIVENLFKDSVTKKQTMTVGCISPYKAQVDAILAKLGNKYSSQTNGSSTFTVNVRSVDGFQGSEEDVIIFSTVRCNHRGSVGFLSSRERANVALTRSRHCMWIVGNKETMIKSGTVWNTLVSDAEHRGCVYNARDKKNLARVMLNAMVESANFQSLFETHSILFKEAIWKVNFTNMFIKKIVGIANLSVRKLVISLLVKLSNGWRQRKTRKRNMYNDAQGMSSNMLETYNIDGRFYLVWRVDIIYENSSCVQVLKFLDILTMSQIRYCAKRLESDFGAFTFDNINRCQTKRVARNLDLPMTWPVDYSWHDSTSPLTSQLANLSIDI